MAGASGEGRSKRAYIIVLGNEKGGSGKTTTSMHLLVALMRAGFSVASLDLDGRQKTLSRYLDNRRRWMAEHQRSLCLPEHQTLFPSRLDSVRAAAAEDRERLAGIVAELATRHDFVVIDCPGSDVTLSRIAHRLADTLITPLNDSLLDLDVVVQIHDQTLDFEGPGPYALMVMEQRQERLKKAGGGMDWILLRNRLSPLNSHNAEVMNDVLAKLSRAIGCRVALGIGERVIFRQLFLSGLTVLDLREPGMEFHLTASHDQARREVRQLLNALWLPSLSRRLDRI